MLVRNVGSFSLDCQVSAASNARSGLWAAGDGAVCAAGRNALYAAAAVRACGGASNALPSCDGAGTTTAARIIGPLVSSEQWRYLLSEPLLLRRDYFRVGASCFESAFFRKSSDWARAPGTKRGASLQRHFPTRFRSSPVPQL